MYLCIRNIYFASFYDFYIDFRVVPTVSYFYIDFEVVPTVSYFYIDFGVVPTVVFL